MTVLDYITSALRGVFVCPLCGALVANVDTHDEFHDQIDDLQIAISMLPDAEIEV